jgi:hypothetical protein
MKKIIILSLLMAFVYPLFAQSSNSEQIARVEIKDILLRETGLLYSVNARNINERKYSGEYLISDINDLLKDCFVFCAKDSSSSKILLGVYKNGSIIWKTQQFINGEGVNYTGELWQIADLKHDGKNYVIYSFTFAPLGQIESLWIFSWDGNEGNLVNQYDENGYSSIVANSSTFVLIDIEGDGLLELEGIEFINEKYNEETDEEEFETKDVIFSWQNGIIGNYGITKPTILPKDKVDVKVKGTVKMIGGNFYYSYDILNKKTSLQNIENFTIGSKIDTIIANRIPLKWNLFNREDLSIIHFDTDPYYTIDRKIYPGESENNFEIVSNYLPAIVKYYIQGSNGERDNLEQIFDNSKKGFTIGPKMYEDSVTNQNLLDTLINYETYLLNLGWDKYFNYLVSSKSALQQNNISTSRTNLQNILRDVDIDISGLISSEAYSLLRYNTVYLLNKLPQPPPGLIIKLISSMHSKLHSGTLQYYEGAWKDAIDNGDGTFSVDTKQKTVSLRMTYAYGSQTKSNVTVGTDTVVFQTVNAKVQLQNSIGAALDTGRVQYYSGAWREFGTTANGTAAKELLPGNYSFRMSYAYASTDKAQDISINPNVVFQTVNAQVQLQNSSGNLIDQGTVQYYSGAWRDFGATTNGVASKELLPNNYSFRMTYAFASTDKQQDLKTNQTVVFQTVNAQVQLRNSLGNLIDAGTVQYYSGAWRDFGTTANGIASKELLPSNYSFRMTYAFASTDKQQDLKTNPTVVFQTVNAQVQLKNSLGNLIDAGTVQYYSGAWRDFGTTANGITSKELLPNNYSFRMTYAFASTDKQQDLKINPTVVFQTANAQVQLKNSLGNLVDAGTVQYYSGAWRDFGATTNGIASKELLPSNYSFRMTYAFASTDKQQDLKINPTVVFQTVNAQVQLKNSLGNLIDAGTVQYYSGAWREFGATTNGVASKELLPNNYSFRMTHEYISKDISQNIGTNNIVNFSTVLCTIRVKDAQNNPVNNAMASYYSGAWRQIGLTVNGEITKELLPANLSFRVNYNSVQKDKAQNILTNNIVEVGF